MSARALRNHGPQILQAIVADLATPQTAEEQDAKSRGLAPVAENAPQTAAQTHAVLRAQSGFDIAQLASEYRALRATVLHLWMEACLPDPPATDDMIRFNEAIDQALAESIGFFSAYVDRSRNLFLGMLSHDLRSPLHTIQTTARHLRILGSTGDVGDAAERLIRSGARMQQLLDDLIDFNRTELGIGLRVAPRDVDLGEVCAEELDQIRATYTGMEVKLEVAGDCRGTFDAGRIRSRRLGPRTGTLHRQPDCAGARRHGGRRFTGRADRLHGRPAPAGACRPAFGGLRALPRLSTPPLDLRIKIC